MDGQDRLILLGSMEKRVWINVKYIKSIYFGWSAPLTKNSYIHLSKISKLPNKTSAYVDSNRL